MSEPRRSDARVVVDLAEELANAAGPLWAASRLADVLQAAGVPAGVGGAGEVLAVRVAVGTATGTRPGDLGPLLLDDESFAFDRPAEHPEDVEIIAGGEPGAIYGLLELADRVEHGGDPMAILTGTESAVQSPAVPIRSVLRTFASEIQDKDWFYDRAFWREYLTELATQRINRFHLAFGMQYNYLHDLGVEDNYLCFVYPFLFDVRGYDVRAEGVSHGEQARNLAALRFISDEAALRGIHFQLGLWNHAYDPTESPELQYPIRGLVPEQLAAYSATALSQLLTVCPSIRGITFRVHYEGGVPEAHQVTFWRTVLGAVGRVGRRVEIDLHAKGVDDELLELALGTGQPVVVSGKYWAEHQGLPYHQTRVRDLELFGIPSAEVPHAKANVVRRVTRYGYADFLREDRDYGVLFRIWPGTQKVLLWGDPALAAGYGRLATFGGALGVELCEPLTFKGRCGSGWAGGRDPYADPSLRLGRDDWKKYLYTYRLWGRLLYDPGADAESWRRFLRREHGPAAVDLERALAAASRVLPLVTVVHGISASNNVYCPELYVNMPISRGASSAHYAWDTAVPRTFAGVSSLDPGLFDRIEEHAEDLLAGRRNGRYTPSETAGWLEALADEAEGFLAAARSSSPDPETATFRRVAVDIAAQAGLGRFFAGKTRAGVSYLLYERTKDLDHLEQSIAAYQRARDAFASVVQLTTGVYQPNLAFGKARSSQYGHWADRLPPIDQDLEELHVEQALAAAAGETRSGGRLPEVASCTRIRLCHEPAQGFIPGEGLCIEASSEQPFDGRVALHYRHLDHTQEYQVAEMREADAVWSATIPGRYLSPSYPVAYHFTLHHRGGDAWPSPGLDETLSNQPYYVVSHRHPAR